MHLGKVFGLLAVLSLGASRSLSERLKSLTIRRSPPALNSEGDPLIMNNNKVMDTTEPSDSQGRPRRTRFNDKVRFRVVDAHGNLVHGTQELKLKILPPPQKSVPPTEHLVWTSENRDGGGAENSDDSNSDDSNSDDSNSDDSNSDDSNSDDSNSDDSRSDDGDSNDADSDNGDSYDEDAKEHESNSRPEPTPTNFPQPTPPAAAPEDPTATAGTFDPNPFKQLHPGTTFDPYASVPKACDWGSRSKILPMWCVTLQECANYQQGDQTKSCEEIFDREHLSQRDRGRMISNANFWVPEPWSQYLIDSYNHNPAAQTAAVHNPAVTS